MTNREKFKEVFGFTPNDDAECVAPKAICTIQDDVCAVGNNECAFYRWWDKEYKECFRLKDELDR